MLRSEISAVAQVPCALGGAGEEVLVAVHVTVNAEGVVAAEHQDLEVMCI